MAEPRNSKPDNPANSANDYNRQEPTYSAVHVRPCFTVQLAIEQINHAADDDHRMFYESENKPRFAQVGFHAERDQHNYQWIKPGWPIYHIEAKHGVHNDRTGLYGQSPE